MRWSCGGFICMSLCCCWLEKIGALRLVLLAGHQNWRLLTCPYVHAGAFHMIINLSSVIFLGIYLEQEFGPLMTGIIYILSAFCGSLIAALVARNSPVSIALVILFALSAINFGIGLLPYVDNFANIGGFLSGVLLGFVLLFNPQIREVALNKAGFYDYGVKSSMKLKEKLDSPVMRIVSLLLFVFACVCVTFNFIAQLLGLTCNLTRKPCLYPLQSSWNSYGSIPRFECQPVLQVVLLH
ncbi:hypothetical protein HS088_TW11G00326 [Tripterygium wilfordii]|uniref:RHOMBOID-like protein n=1 Tax=Tripterygium wilfordii TaxID=458696 RepID=A0A7J7D1R0_TRIWF|nr:hypothetical protein HS088_TW11G00326 [Tripterygium wilfordii]